MTAHVHMSPAPNHRALVVGAAAAAVGVLLLAAPAVTERFEPPGAPTIFVSVASYRDADCIETVRALFDSAARPDRVFVGICEQNKDASEACVPGEFKWNHRVRRLTIPHGEAKGPTYARYLCSTLFRGEAYFCQIDSHTRFVKHWDAKCVAMLKQCPADKPVLTHYPHDMEQHGKTVADVPVLCKSGFDDNGVLTFEAVSMAPAKRPKPVPFTSGGFVFGPGSMLREVPYDPDLPHLFQGEEILYSARLWTSGYDFFTPTENIVFHRYGRDASPKYWNDLDGYKDGLAPTLKKVKGILEGRRRMRYGLGGKRTIEQYWKFAGVDYTAKTSSSEAKFCT